MKLPVVWITVAFAVGIALATALPRSAHIAAHTAAWIVIAVALMLLGALLAWRNLLVSAWMCALAAWIALGGVAVALERASVPANHVTRLIAAGRLDTSEPLRWRGRLREDPMALPWGRRYEIDLEEVDVQGAALRVSGGLRADLYASERRGNESPSNESANGAAPPELRAGDRVEALMHARHPRNFLDPGAFDLRGYMALQKIDLTGSVRSGELLRLMDRPKPSMMQRLARLRGDLLGRVDALFGANPERAAVLRAMLLGDKSFVDSETVTAFQKTSAYHILVVAGLHVGALAAFLFWICRKLRLRMEATSFMTLLALAAYVGVVQDRAPILRATLMAAFYLLARPLFRRVDLLNTVALAALALLIWKPSSLVDSSFELSFAAAAVIAGLAVPWMARSSGPYHAALKHLWDVTRDGSHAPKFTQFRIETRDAIDWISTRVPAWMSRGTSRWTTSWTANWTANWPSTWTSALVTLPIRTGLRLWETVLLSTVIQWGMLPLLATDFHRISLQGPISNIPAVILTGLIVPAGFLALAMSFVWSGLALAMAKGVSFGVGLLLASVDWFSRVPHTSYRIPGPPLWLVIAFAGALFALAATARATTHTTVGKRRAQRKKRNQLAAPIALAEYGSAAALLALTVLVATYPFAPSLPSGHLEVNILDVGQGDSSFVAFPDGRTLLIDGGGLAGSERVGGYRSGFDVGENVVSPYLWSQGIKKIDAIALTHGDHDHLDGLRSVIANFRVGELWVGRDDNRAAVQTLLDEARARGVRIAHKAEGDHFAWDSVDGDFLRPKESSAAARPSNDDSLVLRITDGARHFLFTGDIEEHAERAIINDGEAIESDFIKVPHHGSKTSSTERFLRAVSPRIAVISVGEANPFGHPAEAVVERYEHDGVRVLRTDRDGTVTVWTDGKNLAVSTFAAGELSQSEWVRAEKTTDR
ncbi:MAG TPA: ComEC/Rec2 family competence protein [Candidatus Acidoferrales bacterium]|jgi:competence protein ComEC|nr:ComEC/Rec2 family competence protein [Candidatus Acidoferrales bacterium]